KDFSYSFATDSELLHAEVDVNRAYARMLAKVGLISRADARKIVKGLDAVELSWKPVTRSKYSALYEDIHSFIQGELEKRIGAVAKKIHTGRSRNDLVVTSTRVYLRAEIEAISEKIRETQRALVYLARKAKGMIIPGMTHLKKAQPVLLSHHLLAYVEMLQDDSDRLRNARARVNVLGLGSAALAGSALPLDQKFLARELGFERITSNSMAATSDRAFIAEVLSVLAMLWMHLSRLADDFILWNSEPFNFVELDDEFATGSSLMPQKKNPDIFELIRGRSGVIFGHLMSILTIQKGLSLCYNRDLQEDKPGLFDTIYKTHLALKLLPLTLRSVTFNPESMALSLLDDTLFATDIVEYLVRKGMAFSDAHETVGKVIRTSIESRKPLRALKLDVYKKFSNKFGPDIYKLFNAEASVRAKKTVGSTNPGRVGREMTKWERLLRKK
ncbi:MAG: argininosuccinate lyase, partial [Candidatus Omnitrophica bacterium]|nr:argininosuccinate lyase [Candidatus Omnitrophota bacterium]